MSKLSQFAFIVVGLLVFAVLATTVFTGGCSSVPPEKVAKIHKTVGTVLDIAYTAGGATLVEQKIDDMVSEGKITPEQAVQLKVAAQKSYDALQAKLNEMSVKEVIVESKE